MAGGASRAPRPPGPPRLLTMAAVVVPLAASAPNRSDTSYDLYPYYPPYCATPANMRTRSVPPLLRPEEYAPYGIASTGLAQVVPIIRHGARTPWSDRIVCWDGYWTDPETGVWDCDLTTIVAPPSPPFVTEVEVRPEEVNDPTAARAGDDAMFLFEKRYDALHHPPELSNAMNGTCMIGQLLLRGYEQEMTNGRHLRDAYVYDRSNEDNMAAVDARMRLFDLTADAEPGTARPYEPPNLYYRVDDEQRTLMSGEVLIRGLFGDLLQEHSDESDEDPMIIAHTADYRYDVVGYNSRVCPRLDDLLDEAEDSEVFQAFKNSEEAGKLRTMMEETVGLDFTDDATDCLMTTMCTDRPLPDVLNDYVDPDADASDAVEPTEYDEKYGANRFQRLLDYATHTDTYHLRHNDSAYSKLAMGPLWYEMLRQMRPVFSWVEKSRLGPDVSQPPRLALFSGHDSTVQALLASLGGDVWDGSVWAPYASMLIIEIHEITERTKVNSTPFQSSHAFRLLYNGEVLTQKMDGCPRELDLCDISVLLDRIEPFATVDRDCASSAEEAEPGGALERAEALLTAPGGVALFACAVVAGMAVGSLATSAYLTRSLPCCGSGARAMRSGFTRDLPLEEECGGSLAPVDSISTGEGEPAAVQHVSAEGIEKDRNGVMS